MKKCVHTLADLFDLGSMEQGDTIIFKEEINIDNSAVIVFPEKVKLQFDKGAKLKKGTVKLYDNFVIDTMNVIWEEIIFENNFVVETSGVRRNAGSFTNDFIRPEWFYNENDKTSGIQLAVDIACRVGNTVQLAPRKYTIQDTIFAHSNTIIKGCLYGSFDRNLYGGSVICADFSNIVNGFKDGQTIPAICFYCRKDVDGDNDNYLNTCYKFKLSNFGLSSTEGLYFKQLTQNGDESKSNIEEPAINQIRTVGIQFIADGGSAGPRDGVVEDMIISQFGIGIEIRSLSNVEFKHVSINDYFTGICAHKKYELSSRDVNDKYNIENVVLNHLWFEEVFLNTGRKPNLGIHIESGEYIYFNNIDVNDSNKGIDLETTEVNNPISHVFFNRINLTRCIDCISLNALNAYITRLIFSDITLGLKNYEETNNVLLREQNDNNSSASEIQEPRTCIDFRSNGGYIIADSVFTNIFQSERIGGDEDYFMKNSTVMTMSSLTFTNLRAFNTVQFKSDVKKLDFINYDTIIQLNVRLLCQ